MNDRDAGRGARRGDVERDVPRRSQIAFHLPQAALFIFSGTSPIQCDKSARPFQWLPLEVAARVHPDWKRNEKSYWARRESLLREYQGQWIGFADDAVIASGDSPVQVLHAAQRTGRHPFVTCVGREDTPQRMRFEDQRVRLYSIHRPAKNCCGACGPRMQSPSPLRLSPIEQSHSNPSVDWSLSIGEIEGWLFLEGCVPTKLLDVRRPDHGYCRERGRGRSNTDAVVGVGASRTRWRVDLRN